MTGLRLGYVALHDAKLRERMKKALFYTASNVSSVVQYGGIGALEGSQDSVAAFRSELQARRDLFYAGIREHAAGVLSGAPPKGRVLRVPADRSGMAAGAAVRRPASLSWAHGGTPDLARPDRLRPGRRLRRATAKATSGSASRAIAGAHRRARVDGNAVCARRRNAQSSEVQLCWPLKLCVTTARNTAFKSASPHVAAAVDADRFAGDEVRFEQKRHRLDDFRLAAPSAERRGRLPRPRALRRVVPGGATIGPGAMALTRIWSPASSSASASVRPMTPRLAT